MYRILLILLFALASSSIALAEDSQTVIIPEPPELPSQTVSGEPMSPDITITRQKKAEITEYSIDGRVYMVKVSPKNAPPYYMIDTDGDGDLETRKSDLEEGLHIPHWILHSW